MRLGRTILIIDDERDIRDVIAAAFEARGWDVLLAENGEQGLILAAREIPTLIVLDILMPGKTGMAVFSELRADSRTVGIPVIMVSAINDTELSEHRDAESIGASLGVRAPEAYLDKPLDSDRLVAVAERVTLGSAG